MSWMLTRRTWSWLTRATAGFAVLLAMSVPADARRGSSSPPAKSAPAAATPAAPSSAAKGAPAVKGAPPAAKLTAFDAALLGLQVQRATSNKVRFLYELPEMKANTLRDGRHFHIGEVTSMFSAPRLVGWISRSEFVELERHHVAFLLEAVSFKSIETFQQHILKYGPSREPGKPADETSVAAVAKPATAATVTIAAGSSVMSATAPKTAKLNQVQVLALGGGCILLVGFLGYCFISWRRNRADAVATAEVAVTPDPSVASRPVPARAGPLVPSSGQGPSTPARPGSRPARPAQRAVPLTRAPASGAEASPRRAARDLGTLTQPKPA